VHDAFGTLANTFAIFNIVARLLLAYMWMTAYRTDLEKQLSIHFSMGLLVSSILFATSVFAGPYYRIILWVGAIIADLASPLFSLDIQARLPRISTSHLPERFGLLIILTLGETVISAVKGFTQLKQFTWLTGIIATESLLITFMIWWLYIDHVMYRVFKPSLLYALSWCYLHLPLFIAIIALSATVGIITTTSYSGPWGRVSAGLEWQLAILVSLVLVIMALLNVVSESHGHHHKVIEFHDAVERGLILYKAIGLVVIIAAVAFVKAIGAPVFLLMTIIVGLAVPVMHGLYIWVKAHLHKATMQ
jgi:low temperature requirement protein LtrA